MDQISIILTCDLLKILHGFTVSNPYLWYLRWLHHMYHYISFLGYRTVKCSILLGVIFFRNRERMWFMHNAYLEYRNLSKIKQCASYRWRENYFLAPDALMYNKLLGIAFIIIIITIKIFLKMLYLAIVVYTAYLIYLNWN